VIASVCCTFIWHRDKSSRSSAEVLVAVAHDTSLPAGGGGGGAISVYASLLLPVEAEDELAWLRWPMAVGGVLVFVLFKMFGVKKAPRPNTSGGTHSKFGKYSSRFSGSSGSGSSGGGGGSGEGVSASELKQLREKLSQIENS
jgi:hypothetical protein